VWHPVIRINIPTTGSQRPATSIPNPGTRLLNFFSSQKLVEAQFFSEKQPPKAAQD
jgi:hypothetical protein